MKLFLLLTLIAAFIVLQACGKPTMKSAGTSAKARPSLLKKPMELGFEQIVSDPRFKGLKMLGDVNKNGVDSIDGVLLRTLRLKNIADAVDARYGLTGPGTKGLVLAMVAHESGGADLLPNGSDDGGAGFSHMQPCTARQFGLNVYQNCNKLVDHEHGRALRALITVKHFDRKELIKYDDRLHPVLNLDAVGRMIATFIRSAPKNSNPAEYAMRRYSGRKEYYAAIMKWRSRLSDENLLAGMKSRFNAQNSNLTLNGAKIDCDGYLAACREQNKNYGLAKYIGK